MLPLLLLISLFFPFIFFSSSFRLSILPSWVFFVLSSFPFSFLSPPILISPFGSSHPPQSFSFLQTHFHIPCSSFSPPPSFSTLSPLLFLINLSNYPLLYQYFSPSAFVFFPVSGQNVTFSVTFVSNQIPKTNDIPIPALLYLVFTANYQMLVKERW